MCGIAICETILHNKAIFQSELLPKAMPGGASSARHPNNFMFGVQFENNNLKKKR